VRKKEVKKGGEEEEGTQTVVIIKQASCDGCFNTSLSKRYKLKIYTGCIFKDFYTLSMFSFLYIFSMVFAFYSAKPSFWVAYGLWCRND
jgi:hypothetical protein